MFFAETRKKFKALYSEVIVFSFCFSVYERRSLPRQERNDLPAFTADPSEHPKPEAMEELRTHIEVLQEQVGVQNDPASLNKQKKIMSAFYIVDLNTGKEKM